MLIHVGVDTVEMKGDGFSPKVKEGDKVKKGDLLLEMDLDKIAAAGRDRPHYLAGHTRCKRADLTRAISACKPCLFGRGGI